MKFILSFFMGTIALAMLIGSILISSAQASTPYSRIKDIADIEGVRSNILIGYGLIVGLSGTGDSANSIPFTRQTLVDMLGKMGINSKDVASQIKTKNVASVMITANMPSFSRQGSKIDVTVSSLGDAKSLKGGQLIATALVGADGNTYAIAQGAVLLGGFTASGGGSSITQNHTTSGRIANGATVEVETGHELASQERIRLILRNPDFTTAVRLVNAVNKAFKGEMSHAVDNGTIDIKIPKHLRGEMVTIIHKLENIKVRPDTVAKVIIDEKTGTIVMGSGVQISNVAISHSNLTVRIKELREVVQANSFSSGSTVAVENTQVSANSDEGKFEVLETGVNLADLIDGLNSLGVKPRDIISILQTIKAAGALQAEIVLM